MNAFHKTAYRLGQAHALVKLGMGTAEDFAALVEGDVMDDPAQQDLADLPEDEKPVHWGGGASLEGGDNATRQEEMGLPSHAAV